MTSCSYTRRFVTAEKFWAITSAANRKSPPCSVCARTDGLGSTGILFIIKIIQALVIVVCAVVLYRRLYVLPVHKYQEH